MSQTPLNPIIGACLREVELKRQNLESGCKPFLEGEASIWKDDCDYAINVLRSLVSLIQNCHDFLKSAKDIAHPMAMDSRCLPFEHHLYQVKDLSEKLITLIITFTAMSGTLSRDAITRREEIRNKLMLLQQNMNEITAFLTTFQLSIERDNVVDSISIDPLLEDVPAFPPPKPSIEKKSPHEEEQHNYADDMYQSEEEKESEISEPIAPAELTPYIINKPLQNKPLRIKDLTCEDLDLPKLRQIMESAFDDAELVLLCADLGINPDDISGDRKANKVYNLVEHFRRRRECAKLVRRIIHLRLYVASDLGITPEFLDP